MTSLSPDYPIFLANLVWLGLPHLCNLYSSDDMTLLIFSHSHQWPYFYSAESHD